MWFIWSVSFIPDLEVKVNFNLGASKGNEGRDENKFLGFMKDVEKQILMAALHGLQEIDADEEMKKAPMMLRVRENYSCS